MALQPCSWSAPGAGGFIERPEPRASEDRVRVAIDADGPTESVLYSH